MFVKLSPGIKAGRLSGNLPNDHRRGIRDFAKNIVGEENISSCERRRESILVFAYFLSFNQHRTLMSLLARTFELFACIVLININKNDCCTRNLDFRGDWILYSWIIYILIYTWRYILYIVIKYCDIPFFFVYLQFENSNYTFTNNNNWIYKRWIFIL